MLKAKDIRVEVISVQDARRIIKSLHYSGKVDPRSSVNLGIFLNGKCGGAIQMGTPIDKRKAIGIVAGTKWDELLDIHRLALADWLPRNSESRAIAYSLKLVKKRYPQLKWVQSYADATQCGDGTIYRASGFHLISIKPNSSMYRMPDGNVVCKLVLEPSFSPNSKAGGLKARYGKTGSETATAFLKDIGAKLLDGFQLRYIFFYDDAEKKNLTVPILPYTIIKEMKAGMYKGHQTDRPIGEKVSRQTSSLE